MSFFLVQAGQVLQSPVDARTFTADAKGIVEVPDDLQPFFHNMGATLWVEAPSGIIPSAPTAPLVVSDPPKVETEEHQE